MSSVRELIVEAIVAALNAGTPPSPCPAIRERPRPVNADQPTALTSQVVTLAANPWPFWQPSTNYNVGDLVLDGNSYVQICTQAGTSGAAPPAWNDVDHGTTADNEAAWAFNNQEATNIVVTVDLAAAYLADVGVSYTGGAALAGHMNIVPLRQGDYCNQLGGGQYLFSPQDAGASVTISFQIQEVPCFLVYFLNEKPNRMAGNTVERKITVRVEITLAGQAPLDDAADPLYIYLVQTVMNCAALVGAFQDDPSALTRWIEETDTTAETEASYIDAAVIAVDLLATTYTGIDPTVLIPKSR